MKKLFLILLCIIAVAIAAYYLFLRKRHQPVVNQEIEKRLIQLVQDASNGLYHLQMDSLEANIVDSRLTLFRARLIPDTLLYKKLLDSKRAPQDLFEVSVDQFTLDDVSPVDFLTAKEINLKKIIIRNPVINVKHQKLAYASVDDDSAKTIFQRLESKISGIKVDTIFIQQANVTYDNRTKHKINHLDKVSFLASDFLLDESTQNDTTRFLFAKNCKIHLEDYKIYTPDSLYRLHVGDLTIETAAKLLRIDKLTFAPTVNISQFYKIVKHQQDHFTLSINRIMIRDIEWWSMIGDEALTVNKVEMEGSKLEIYNDKSMPVDARSKVGKYPHQLLMKVAYGMKIDTTSVSNMNLSYTELNPKSGKTGTLSFNDINAQIVNITNDSASILKRPLLRISAKAKFMNEAPLSASFVFDLRTFQKGNFEVSAKLGHLSAEAINKLSVPLGLVKVESVDVKGLEASMKGDNYQATGTVKFEYENLKISIMKNAEDTMKKRKLFSFLANSFFIINQNPDKGKPVRVAPAQFKRDVNRSFFNLVWKTIFTGAKISVGYK